MTIESLNLEPVLGTRAAKYIPRFRGLLEKAGGDLAKAEKQKGWNWAAFLGNGYWLIYHRDYLRGFGLLAIIIILPLLIGTTGAGLILLASISCGLMGDAMLLRYVRQLAERRERIATDEGRAAFDRRYAGGSWPMAIGAFVAMGIAVIVLDPEARSDLGLSSDISCSSSEAKKLVIEIIRRSDFGNALVSLKDYGLQPEFMRYQLDDIRTVQSNGRVSQCAATMHVTLNATFDELPASHPARNEMTQRIRETGIETAQVYQVSRTDDGRLYVRVR